MGLQLNDEATDLFAAIIAHNVDEAKRISDLLIDGQERDAKRFAQALLDLVDGLERIPDMVRSSYIDGLLTRTAVVADQAYRKVNGPDAP